MPFLEQKLENCQESLLSVLDLLIGNVDSNALKCGQPEVFENFCSTRTYQSKAGGAAQNYLSISLAPGAMAGAAVVKSEGENNG